MPRTSSAPSSGSRCWRGYHSILAKTCGKTSSRSYNEIPLRRMRPANAVRGAAAPGGRHVGGGVPLPDLRSRGRVAHKPYGDSARRIPGREDRRGDDRTAAPRNGEGDGYEGTGRRPWKRGRGDGHGGKGPPPLGPRSAGAG